MEAQQEHIEAEEAPHELTRKERERLTRRHLMLDAACAVFAEKGYADATLDEVAQRAEFGKGTIYNYFEGGKEEILFAVFDDLYDALCRLVEETFNADQIGERPFREVFEGFLTALFAFFRERQDQFMIMMKEGHRMTFTDQPEKVAYFFNQSERVIQALKGPLEAAMEKGIIRPLPSEAIAHMILGNVKGHHMHMFMQECRCGPPALKRDGDGRPWTPPSPEQAASFIATFLLDGILERGASDKP